MLVVHSIRLEHFANALGVGVTSPRLSWKIETDARNWRQAAYEIEARGQTVRVKSDQSVLVPWPFPALAARERLSIRVRVWGIDGQVSDWSGPAFVEAGLLTPDDWLARFITPDWEEDTSRPQPCPYLRHEFAVRAGVAQARLYVTALGLYEAYLNGVVIGDQLFSPGFTNYHHMLRYQTFDITGLLKPGHNAIGAVLAEGWYRGRLGWGEGRRNIYGERLALLAQVEISYADGTTERWGTDETWRASTGPLLSSEIYDGEVYDARLEKRNWSLPGYDDQAWSGVRLMEWDFATLVAPLEPPVRRTQLIAPQRIFASPSGRTLIDFGQNLVGRLRLTMKGSAGQAITLRHAEVLENGELSIRPLRSAKATDRYILRGGGPETWEPRFTFHGFRYAEVDGWPGELASDQIQAVVCHSDLERTGWFECSDPLLNRFHENVVWSMRGNFLDIPTDCPQRDERLGWTGDIQFFSPTACFLYDTAGFLQSWLRVLAGEQRAGHGAVPWVVPNVLSGPVVPAAAWGDAATVVPWVLYQRYGDAQVLSAQFDSMCAWVDTLASLAGESRLWDTGFQFGDWLDPAAPPEDPAAARTPPAIVATAYFARSAELTAMAAGVLGHVDAEAKYRSLAAEVRLAFNQAYVRPDGRLLSDSATAYALALQFGLLRDAAQRQRAGERLAALFRESDYHISTGLVGTPLVCDALCSVGDYETAFRLLLQRTCPSWLYPVTMGATTIWERWDSLLPDGSVNPGQMTSFNHYALGAVADWINRTVGGLAPAEPGYRRLEFRPHPGAGLTHAHARLITLYGLAESSWKVESGHITVQVTVPPNTSAHVVLPGKDSQAIELGSGRYEWTYPFSPECPAQAGA